MAILATELRIGNWVKFLSKTFQATSGTIEDCWKANISESPYQYEAIPLTPEILEKCDLIKYFHIKKHKDKSLYGYEYYYKPAEELNWVPLPHLHQLQNLYFVLTGTELNYQP